MDALYSTLAATLGLCWLLLWYATFGILLALFRLCRDGAVVVLCALGVRCAWKYDAEQERAHNEQVAARESAETESHT